MKHRLILCFLLLPAISMQAQTRTQQAADTLNRIGTGILIQRIESANGVSIFYKPEWFVDKMMNAGFSQLPLNEALARICENFGLKYVVIDETNIIFLKSEITQTARKDGNELPVIGNLAEAGKYQKAVINGTVYNGSTRVTLPGAMVMDEKSKVFALTDREGKYSLSLPAGIHTLKVQYVGHENVSQKIKLVSNGTFDFDIFEKSIQLQEVVITDRRADFNVSRTQMSAVRMDSKILKELPVSIGETDIIKSVALMPGVQSVGEFGSGFIVRGGNTDQNLILIEDAPIFNTSHLFGLNSIVNSDAISNVTLYKAGLPARYGERSSSVMLLRLGQGIVDKPSFKGGVGLLNSRLSVETPVAGNKISLLAGGRTSYSDWLLKRLPDIDLQHSSAGFYDLNALLTINAGSNDKISIFGYYSYDRFAFSSDVHYTYHNMLASARWNHIFGKDLLMSAVAATSRYRFKVTEFDSLRTFDGNQIVSGLNYHNVKVIFTWTPGNKHTVDVGAAGTLYINQAGEMKPYGGASLVNPVQVQREKGLESAAFISDDFSISERMSAETGIRFVHYLSFGPGYSYYYAPGLPLSTETITDTLTFGNDHLYTSATGFEPRLALRWSIDERRSLKLSYNRIHQFIFQLSNTSVISPTDTWKLSGQYLNPMVSDQFALGLFSNFSENAIETSVEVYVKKLSHLPEYKNGAQLMLNNHIETELLDARAKSYGLELYAKKNSGKMTGWVSYTYSRAIENTSSTLSEEQVNGNRRFPANFDIPHNLVLNLNFHLSRRWRVSGTYNGHSGRPVTLPELKYISNGNQLIYFSDRNKYRLPAYHRLDLAVTLDQGLQISRKWKSRWTFSIINVLGRKNAYSAFYAREDERTWNYSGSYNLYTLYILGIPLPTLTYNFSF